MDSLRRITRRINVNFTFVQCACWMVTCTIIGFVTVYLTDKGLTDAQIGIVIAMASVLAMVMQAILSDFSDKHPSVPLKRITAAVILIIAVGAALMAWIPPSVAFLAVTYTLFQACSLSLNGFMNALMMQEKDIGLPVNFGIARGAGSASCALIAFAVGHLIERFSSDVMMPLTIGLSACAIVAVLLMPRPDKLREKYDLKPLGKVAEKKSIAAILRGNPVLVLALVTTVLACLTHSLMTSFLIRSIESVGGSSADLGTCSLLTSALEMPTMLLGARLLKRFHAGKLLVVSYLGFALKSLALALAPSVAFILASSVLSLVAMGLYGVSSVYFVNSIVKEDEIVRGQSLLSLCGTSGLAAVLGALLGGMLMEALGISALFFICAGLSLLAMGLGIYMNRLYKRNFAQEEV